MADESERDDLIQQFTSVTGTDTQRAQFYLESSAWQLQFALSSFFDEGAGEEMDDDDEDYKPPVSSSETNTNSSSRATKGNSRIKTIAGFSAEENEDSDEEGQAYYAGGSEHSGQQIVGPPRKRREKESDDKTQSIFDAAKRHGAEVVDKSKEESRTTKKTSAFRGSGYRLGETDDESNPITSASSDSIGQQEPVEVTLTFWSNGFSVDNGPLRELDAPENKEFLDSVKRGEIPRELLRLNRGGEVHVNMVDNRHDEFVKPKETRKAFTGEGHTLGSPTPRMAVSKSETATITSTTVPTPSTVLDDSVPVTSLQIRLADGTRLVAKFNHTHKISDIRKFVNASRPHSANQNFVLMTTFPNKELSDDSLTLKEANLLNAVVVQRFKS